MSFVVIVFIFSLSGIILALLNNDLAIEKKSNYQLMKKYNRIMNDIKDEKQIIKKIEVKKEELKNLDEENKKNIVVELQSVKDFYSMLKNIKNSTDNIIKNKDSGSQ